MKTSVANIKKAGFLLSQYYYLLAFREQKERNYWLAWLFENESDHYREAHQRKETRGLICR